ncbi:kinase-like domain-containing protein [Mycena crocata]|nr:kinase-like domain-containing protein [Mycena crocata]
MQRWPLKPALSTWSPKTSSASPVASTHYPGSSKGQIHLNMIQTRAISASAQPYVVIKFEQNEFVSREPQGEADHGANSAPTTHASSFTRRWAAFHARAEGSAYKSNKLASTSSCVTTPLTLSSDKDLIGGKSALVSFDVTSEASLLTFNVYDCAHRLLGTAESKPVLIHDHVVDQWYTLRTFENKVISGELRVRVTFEQVKTTRALTPRDFEFLKLIGRGTSGKVFQVRKRDTRRIYAIKILSKKEIVVKNQVAHTVSERKILERSIESPFLVGLKFSFQTDADLYLVTDFISGGELYWHLQREMRFSEERARFYVAELVLALGHLHKCDIIYRDLKPENILLDAIGHIALCDFGLSKSDMQSDELTTTFCGTAEYLAPEMLLDDIPGYSKVVDFWSLGVLLFEMCCGWSPFYNQDTQQMYKNICFGKIRFPKGALNEDGKHFLKGLLNRNPKHRLGAIRDAEELKEHPFFSSINWAALARKQVTPPFKPVVESEESTANFDEIFTSASLYEVGLAQVALGIDEEYLSKDWAGSMSQHQANGPLRSERKSVSPKPMSPALSNNALSSSSSSSSPSCIGVPPLPEGIDIEPKKKREDSPLTNSMQEHFRGFTYSGEQSVIARMRVATKTPDDEHEGDDGACGTEDEFEDPAKSVGRYCGNVSGL